LDYPSREQEIEILERHGSKSGAPDLKTFGVKAVATPASIKAATNIIPQIRLGDDVSHYIVDLVRGTRSNPLFETGASPRAAAMIRKPRDNSPLANPKPISRFAFYPTQKAIWILGLGLPLALILSVIFPQLWAIGAAWAAAIIGLVLLDTFLATPVKMMEPSNITLVT